MSWRSKEEGEVAERDDAKTKDQTAGVCEKDKKRRNASNKHEKSGSLKVPHFALAIVALIALIALIVALFYNYLISCNSTFKISNIAGKLSGLTKKRAETYTTSSWKDVMTDPLILVLTFAAVSFIAVAMLVYKTNLFSKCSYPRCKPGVDMLSFIPFVNFFTAKIQKPPKFEENVKGWMKQTEDYLKCDVRNENKEFWKIAEWFSGFRSVHQCSVSALNSIAEMGAVASLNVLSNAWRDIGEFGRLVWLQPDAAEYARRELGEKEKEREREAAQRYVKAYCRIVQGERSPKIVNSATSSLQHHNTTRH